MTARTGGFKIGVGAIVAAATVVGLYFVLGVSGMDGERALGPVVRAGRGPVETAG